MNTLNSKFQNPQSLRGVGPYGPEAKIQNVKMFKSKHNLILVIVSAVFLSFLGLMTVHNYQLVQKEQLAAQNDLEQELLHHAQVLEYFYSERVNDLQGLIAGQEIAAYFEGRALSMSMAYGLKASLSGMARSFSELIQTRQIDKNPIYSRLLFLNAQGRVLVDTKASNEQEAETTWTAFLDSDENQNSVRLIEVQGQPEMVISLPYFFRQQYSGQLIAWLCPCSSYRLLGIRPDDPQPAYYLAVQGRALPYGPDLQSPQLPKPLLSRERTTTVTLKRFSSAGSFASGRKMVAGMMSIPGTPLDLISIQSETEIFGSRINRFMPFLLGLLGLVLLAGTGVIFWGNTRRLLLQTRLDTEAKSRAQIEGMNQQLEKRVKDRTVELERAYLQLQQENEERRKAVEEQQILEKRMARVIEAAPIGICIQQNGQLVYVNPACVQMFGYNQDSEMLGLQPADLVPSEDLETILAPPAKSSTAEAGPAHYGVKGLKADGELFEAVLWMTIIDYEGHKALLGFVVDVSEEERLRRQFLQAQKMESVGRLAGGVAHDFNNLLTIILGYADQLMSELDSNTSIRQEIQEIKQAGERAASLTRQLLAFSRKQILHPEILCLNQLMENTSKMLARIIGEDIELEIKLDKELGLVRVDQGQMEQVLLNLAVNARDAMPRGGRLRIATRNSQVREPAQELANGVSLPPGEYIRLDLSDTGTGMEEQTRTRIFEPFFTTKEQGKGTGLGLATVYGIVKQSQGFIFCTSRPGKGTTFRLYFPRTDEQAEQLQKTKLQTDHSPGSESILLVEDDAGLRKLASRLLQARGYTVLPACNGQEALETSARHQHDIHLLLSDVVLPGMNAVELEKKLRTTRPGIRVLYMSGHAGEVLAGMEIDVESALFLKKPFTPEELSLKVREILDG